MGEKFASGRAKYHTLDLGGIHGFVRRETKIKGIGVHETGLCQGAPRLIGVTTHLQPPCWFACLHVPYYLSAKPREIPYRNIAIHGTTVRIYRPRTSPIGRTCPNTFAENWLHRTHKRLCFYRAKDILLWKGNEGGCYLTYDKGVPTWADPEHEMRVSQAAQHIEHKRRGAMK